MEISYKRERDADFLNTCEQIRKEYGKNYISMENIARKALYKEAQSFYLNNKAYCKIIRMVRIGVIESIKQRHKKDLYWEIYNRYLKLKRENTGFNIMDCVRVIAEQKAPRFYISEGRAINLYYELLKERP
jgi:hypothetical protein